MHRLARLLMPLTMLATCLAGCGHGLMPMSPPVAALPLPAGSPDRHAAIVHQIAPACPAPLSAAQLTRAADYLDAHPDAVAIIGDLDRLDRAARICRGQPRKDDR